MEIQQVVVAVLTAIGGLGVGWWFRNHENSRVRASARGALVGGVVLVIILIWKWIKG